MRSSIAFAILLASGSPAAALRDVIYECSGSHSDCESCNAAGCFWWPDTQFCEDGCGLWGCGATECAADITSCEKCLSSSSPAYGLYSWSPDAGAAGECLEDCMDGPADAPCYDPRYGFDSSICASISRPTPRPTRRPTRRPTPRPSSPPNNRRPSSEQRCLDRCDDERDNMSSKDFQRCQNACWTDNTIRPTPRPNSSPNPRPSPNRRPSSEQRCLDDCDDRRAEMSSKDFQRCQNACWTLDIEFA